MNNNNSNIFGNNLNINNLQNNFGKLDSKYKIIIFAVFLVFVVFVGFIAYIYWTNYKTNKIQNFQEETLLEGMYDCNNRKSPMKIEPSKIPASTMGSEYSLNLWIYVSEAQDRDGYVLKRGPAAGDIKLNSNPGIILQKDTNNLIIYFEKENKDRVEDSFTGEYTIEEFHSNDGRLVDGLDNLEHFYGVNDTLENNYIVEGFSTGITTALVLAEELKNAHEAIEDVSADADKITGFNASASKSTETATAFTNAGDTDTAALFTDYATKATEAATVYGDSNSTDVDKTDALKEAENAYNAIETKVTALNAQQGNGAGTGAVAGGNTVAGGNGAQDVQEEGDSEDTNPPPDMGEDDLETNYITIHNIPLQRWTCLNISVFNKTVDIYVDGKLKGSRTFKLNLKPPGPLPMILGPLHNDMSVKRTGFSGYLSRIKYSNRALNPGQVRQRYEEGPRITKGLWESFKSFFSSSEENVEE